jgi:hypothetical protein
MPKNSVTGESGRLPDLNAGAVALATGGTVDTSVDVIRLIPAAAITGVILAKGQFPGQRCVLMNTGLAASTITMAAAGTSFCADGVTTVIPGLRASEFWWDASSSMWYRVA